MRLAVVLALSIVAATALAQRAPRAGPNAAIASTLASCVPGEGLADCMVALDAAHARPVEGARNGPSVRTVALRGPWLSVEIAGADGVITRVHFQGTHRGVAARRRLYAVFDRALEAPPLVRGGAPAGGCGVGPAWFEDTAARAEGRPGLQLGVEPIAPLSDMAGDPADVFVHARGPDQTVHVCATSAAPPFVDALRAFLASPSF
jgi:hypothetical protein